MIKRDDSDDDDYSWIAGDADEDSDLSEESQKAYSMGVLVGGYGMMRSILLGIEKDGDDLQKIIEHAKNLTSMVEPMLPPGIKDSLNDIEGELYD